MNDPFSPRKSAETSAPESGLLQSFPWWAGILLVSLGFAPLLYCHLAGLLLKPHYQFLALLPVAIWVITMTQQRETRRAPVFGEGVVAALLLLVSIVGLVMATWLWSPWIAAVSGMIAFSSVLVSLGGSKLHQSMLPVWLFCWILVPLPFGFDERLIVSLRGVTTRLSSSVLDQIGILHQAYANVIQLPGRALFVADACSGIQSLYVLLATALFICVVTRRGVLHSLLLLGSTFALVIIENVTRIVSVAWATGYQLDWSRGTNHEILGFVLFGLAALLVLSIDQLLLFLLPESPGSSIMKWFRGQRGAYSHEPSSGEPSVRPASSRAILKIWLLMACCLPLIGLVQLPRLLARPPAVAQLFQKEVQMPLFGEDALPKTMGGFRRVGYETVERVPGDPFGQSSQRWIFEQGSITVGVSLDYPYNGVKDLCECYEMTGWTIENQRVMGADQLPEIGGVETLPANCARAEIGRELFGDGLLLFSSLDSAGDSHVLLKEVAKGDAEKQMTDRWESLFQQETTPQFGGKPPFAQVHILARSFEPIDPVIELQLTKLFLTSRELLSPLILSAIAPNAITSGQKIDANPSEQVETEDLK